MPDPSIGRTGWALPVIAVALAFVVFVIPRGVTGRAFGTWAVASAIGLAIFFAAQAVRNRRAR